ncbi:MAG: diguanylate cyclase [Gaiellaceae bacterium]|nr:diguanylate cyclase [Gaiellaceae bacterium]
MCAAAQPFVAREPPLDREALAAAVRDAVAAASAEEEHARAVDAAVAALAEATGLLVSTFVLEHGRLWLVGQRGYSFVPDGLRMDRGVIGRAVRLGQPQVVLDVLADPDYISAAHDVVSEVAAPLLRGGSVVGLLNVESRGAVPAEIAELLVPLVDALAPRAEAVRLARTIDLPTLARLFVYLGSLRDADEIAALTAAMLAKILPLDAAQVVLWDEGGEPVERASWRRAAERPLLTSDEIEGVHALVDANAVCQVLGAGRARMGPVVWLPLRANGEDLGALVGIVSPGHVVETNQLDLASLLAAHAAATLEAALALHRERRSAQTDPLTGILNRRGLEERLDATLAEMQERRLPVSVMLLDCDDFKEVNDRAGHEFGDKLLVELAERLEGVVPEGAVAARLGGDEFVVMLPGADAESAERTAATVRAALAEAMTEAGFPLRISAGISTFPFDGDRATALLRAADQALYAAKSLGKDRVASFRELLRGTVAQASALEARPLRDRRGGARSDGSVLLEALEAARAIAAERDAVGVCSRLSKSLVFVVGATGCLVSRVEGEYLVDAAAHALRDVSLGPEAAYRIADFPLTQEVLERGEPRALSFLDEEVDPAEAFILRELGMNALLMLPIRVEGVAWGLVEVYEMRLRRFSEDDVAVARFLVEAAERRLAELGPEGPSSPTRPVYELPRLGRLRAR